MMISVQCPSVLTFYKMLITPDTKGITVFIDRFSCTHRTVRTPIFANSFHAN